LKEANFHCCLLSTASLEIAWIHSPSQSTPGFQAKLSTRNVEGEKIILIAASHAAATPGRTDETSNHEVLIVCIQISARDSLSVYGVADFLSSGKTDPLWAKRLSQKSMRVVIVKKVSV
jgi:hypothetical protein